MIGTTRDEAAGSFIRRSFPTGPSAEAYVAWVESEFGSEANVILAQYPSSDFASPFDAMSRLVTDAQFVCESRRMARYLSDEHLPAYLFSYDYVIPDLSADRVVHGVESNIVFGNDYVPPQFVNHVLTPADTALHHAMAGTGRGLRRPAIRTSMTRPSFTGRCSDHHSAAVAALTVC